MKKTPFGYPRQLRLLTAKDFRTVFDKVDIKSPSEHCLMLARYNKNDQPRIGFIISKKNVRHAVHRNRIKRITRNYFRLNQNAIPNIDIIFMGRKGLDNYSNEQLHKLLQKQFNKLINRANKA